MNTGILTLALTFAATIDVYPQDDLWSALSDLQPGDEVIVHEGTYQTPGFIELVLNGTEGMPIIIRAADGESVTIQGVPNQNTLNIEGSWYEFRGFEITVGSHGLRLGNSAHAVFEDVHIHNVAVNTF